MAFNMNHTTPATAPIAIFQMLTLWVASGCTITKSGDGLALFSNTSNILTSGATGAGGLGNSNAWFVVAFGGGEEWCFQRNAVGTNYWRIKVSRAAGFSGGTPSSTRVPAATDERLLCGSGTDASPNGVQIFGNDGTYYFSAGIDTTAPRRMWCEAWFVSGSGLNMWMWRDVVVPTEGTDADLFIRGLAGGGGVLTPATLFNATTGSAGSLPYYLGYVPSATPTVAVHMPFAQTGTGGANFAGNTGTLSISGKDPLLVPRYQRQVAQGVPVTIKGESTLLAFCGPNRANGDRMTVASPNDRVVFALVTTPWDNTVVSL